MAAGGGLVGVAGEVEGGRGAGGGEEAGGGGGEARRALGEAGVGVGAAGGGVGVAGAVERALGVSVGPGRGARLEAAVLLQVRQRQHAPVLLGGGDRGWRGGKGRGGGASERGAEKQGPCGKV